MKIYAVKLLEKITVAENTVMFSFEKPKNFTFIPGQWIRMIIPGIKREKETGERIMSLCSAPSDSTLDITMRISTTLFKQAMSSLKLGDAIELSEASGYLKLHDDCSQSVVFIAGGIGITPFRSMIRDQKIKNFTHEIYLFHCNQTLKSTPFPDDFQKIKSNKFRYIPIFSREKIQHAEHGHITPDMLKKYLQTPLSKYTFYIVGTAAMVIGIKKMLHDLAIQPTNIKMELF